MSFVLCDFGIMRAGIPTLLVKRLTNKGHARGSVYYCKTSTCTYAVKALLYSGGGGCTRSIILRS